MPFNGFHTYVTDIIHLLDCTYTVIVLLAGGVCFIQVLHRTPQRILAAVPAASYVFQDFHMRAC